MYLYRYASLDDGLLSEKCFVRRFRDVRMCTYTTLDSTISLLHTLYIWYSLLPLGYKPVQHVTVLNNVRNCKTMLNIILYYNRNVVMRHITIIYIEDRYKEISSAII